MKISFVEKKKRIVKYNLTRIMILQKSSVEKKAFWKSHKNPFTLHLKALLMNNSEHLDAIKDIRNMMKRSTRFLSLSGLSGVLAGIYALAGAWYGWILMGELIEAYRNCSSVEACSTIEREYLTKFILLAAVILGASLITGFLFSARKAKKAGQRLLDQTALRMLFNLAVPLGTGAIFCYLLYTHNSIELIAPSMLIFYGLALMNASKYTLAEVLYLGLTEIVLGLINALLFLHHGLIFWAIGFGVLHIVYGTIMWYKYDRV